MPSLIKKITSTPKGWSTKPKERLSYYLYFCGQNAIYNLVASFLTTYLMLSIGGLVKTAGIMLAVKVWDAVNDAIFGVLFDKVKFKSGKKFVPWLKISLVFIPLTTVMLFAIPNNFSENAKLIWLAVSYILWDTAYTLCDVPIFGIITSMSENIDERNSIISYKQIWAGVNVGKHICHYLNAVYLTAVPENFLKYAIGNALLECFVELFKTLVCLDNGGYLLSQL